MSRAAYERDRYSKLDHVGRVRRRTTKAIRQHLGWEHSETTDWSRIEREQLIDEHRRFHADD